LTPTNGLSNIALDVHPIRVHIGFAPQPDLIQTHDLQLADFFNHNFRKFSSEHIAAKKIHRLHVFIACKSIGQLWEDLIVGRQYELYVWIFRNDMFGLKWIYE
jgi:hypothetical protein